MVKRTLAPNLAKSTLAFIYDMINSGELTTSQIAEAAGCTGNINVRSSYSIVSYLNCYMTVGNEKSCMH